MINFKQINWRKGLELAKETISAYVHPDLPVTQSYIEHYQNFGLIGEDKLATAMTYALAGGCNVGILGKSGSGKTTLADAVLSTFERVHTHEFNSAKAIFYDNESISKAAIFYVPEIQKIKGTAVTEVLKSLGEKRDIHYKVTVAGEVEERIIEAGASIVFTLADENNYEIEKELSRRCVLLYMTPSENQTRQILQGMVNKNNSKFEEHELQRHSEIAKNLDDFLNPFAEYMASYVPATLDSRSQFSHLLRIYQGCAKINYQHRYFGSEQICTLADISSVHDSYWDNFCHLIGQEKPKPNDKELLNSAKEIIKKINLNPETISSWSDQQNL